MVVPPIGPSGKTQGPPLERKTLCLSLGRLWTSVHTIRHPDTSLAFSLGRKALCLSWGRLWTSVQTTQRPDKTPALSLRKKALCLSLGKLWICIRTIRLPERTPACPLRRKTLWLSLGRLRICGHNIRQSQSTLAGPRRKKVLCLSLGRLRICVRKSRQSQSTLACPLRRKPLGLFPDRRWRCVRTVRFPCPSVASLPHSRFFCAFAKEQHQRLPVIRGQVRARSCSCEKSVLWSAPGSWPAAAGQSAVSSFGCVYYSGGPSRCAGALVSKGWSAASAHRCFQRQPLRHGDSILWRPCAFRPGTSPFRQGRTAIAVAEPVACIAIISRVA